MINLFDSLVDLSAAGDPIEELSGKSNNNQLLAHLANSLTQSEKTQSDSFQTNPSTSSLNNQTDIDSKMLASRMKDLDSIDSLLNLNSLQLADHLSTPFTLNSFLEQGVDPLLLVPSPVDRQEEQKRLQAKERRQVRNKISARNFRQRRKEYIRTLEEEVKEKDEDLANISNELQEVRLERDNWRNLAEAYKMELQRVKERIAPTAQEIYKDGGAWMRHQRMGLQTV